MEDGDEDVIQQWREWKERSMGTSMVTTSSLMCTPARAASESPRSQSPRSSRSWTTWAHKRKVCLLFGLFLLC